MPSPTTSTKRLRAHIITRAEMARRLGVSASRVSQACHPGGALHPALDRHGKGINVLHEAAQAWLERKAAERSPSIDVDALEPDDAATPAKGDQSLITLSTTEAEAVLGPWRAQVDLESLIEPLSTLTTTYGDSKEFAAWLKCRKILEDALKAQKHRERVGGSLIARTTVLRMLEHIDIAFRLLLSDAPRSIAARIAPNDLTRCSSIVRDSMEQILDRARTQMMQSLEADNPDSQLIEVAAE